MRMVHFAIETVLIAITIAFAIAIPFGDDNGFMFAFWWQILGFSQVIHSILIGVFSHKQKELLKWLSIYWIVVIVDLMCLMVAMAPGTPGGMVIGVTTLLVIPSLLALYLWYITFRFRRRPGKAVNDNKDKPHSGFSLD